nr:DUF3883 domain-containing protein [Acholeplasma laidlawii]
MLKLNIDIEEFKEKGFIYKIDATNFNTKITQATAYENRIKYKNWLYNECLIDIEKQINFIKNYKAFENYTPSNVTNSILFDPINHLVSEFGNFFVEVNIDCENIYDSNYSKLNPDKLYEDDLQNDLKAQSIIYFNNEEAFKKWLLVKQEQNNKTISPEDKYKSFENIVTKANSEKFKTLEVKIQKNHKEFSGAVTEKDLDIRDKSRKETGNIGELLIYNLLSEVYGRNKVIPKSEAFVKLGILKPGQASSGNYDLSYFDSDGIERFVEVKSSDGGMFYITPRELKFAKNNSDKYKVFLVFINKLNPELSQYKELPFRFWENNKFALHEIVEKIQCKFNL